MSHMDEHMSPGPRLEPSRAEFTAASYAAEVKELRNVGSGSFGSAILVEVVATGELFVSKKISLEHMAPDEQTKASNEAALLKSLRHQNITEYLGSFVLGNMLHIVMEYCSGGTLQQAMARRERASESFEEEEVFDWFLQIGMALEFIHSKMILHRDIKPSNVFLTKRNLVKLGDFGIAKQMDDTSDFAQTCVGTPYYLSPELIEGRPYNQLSDVWALGVLLFQMVAFRYPFDAPTLPALALKIVNGDHHPLKEDTPADLRELIAILLARSQVERPMMEAVMSLPAVAKRRARFESEMRSLYRGATQTTLASGPPRPATPAAADGVADLQRSQISTGSTIGASSIGPSSTIGGGTLLFADAGETLYCIACVYKLGERQKQSPRTLAIGEHKLLVLKPRKKGLLGATEGTKARQRTLYWHELLSCASSADGSSQMRLCFIPQQGRSSALPPLFLARLARVSGQFPAEAMWELMLVVKSPATMYTLLYCMRRAFEGIWRSLGAPDDELAYHLTRQLLHSSNGVGLDLSLLLRLPHTAPPPYVDLTPRRLSSAIEGGDGRLPTPKPAASIAEVRALAAALCCCGGVHGVQAIDVRLGEEAIMAFAEVLRFSTDMNALRLNHVTSNSNAARASMAALVDMLPNSRAPLAVLDLAHNAQLEESTLLRLMGSFRTLPRALKAMQLDGCGLTPKSIVELGAVLSEGHWPSTLQTLTLAHNSIGRDEGSIALAAALRCSSALTTLDVTHTGMDMPTLFDALLANEQLQRRLAQLHLGTNKLSRAAAAQLAELLSRAASLCQLGVSRTQLLPESFEPIFGAALANAKLSQLSIDASDNEFGERCARGLADQLRRISGAGLLDAARGSCGLIGLKMRSTSLTEGGVCALLEPLAALAHLVQLDLSANLRKKMVPWQTDVPADLGRALVTLVRNCAKLRSLALAATDKDAGTVHCDLAGLPDALADHESLTSVDLTSLKVEDPALVAIATALPRNRKLLTLALHGSKTTAEVLAADASVRLVLDRNRSSAAESAAGGLAVHGSSTISPAISPAISPGLSSGNRAANPASALTTSIGAGGAGGTVSPASAAPASSASASLSASQSATSPSHIIGPFEATGNLRGNFGGALNALSPLNVMHREAPGPMPVGPQLGPAGLSPLGARRRVADLTDKGRAEPIVFGGDFAPAVGGLLSDPAAALYTSPAYGGSPATVCPPPGGDGGGSGRGGSAGGMLGAGALGGGFGDAVILQSASAAENAGGAPATSSANASAIAAPGSNGATRKKGTKPEQSTEPEPVKEAARGKEATRGGRHSERRRYRAPLPPPPEPVLASPPGHVTPPPPVIIGDAADGGAIAFGGAAAIAFGGSAALAADVAAASSSPTRLASTSPIAFGGSAAIAFSGAEPINPELNLELNPFAPSYKVSPGNGSAAVAAGGGALVGARTADGVAEVEYRQLIWNDEGRRQLPPGVNVAKLEAHLSDVQFRQVLGMDRANFYAMTKMDQMRIKQDTGLF
eukprot:jgi/Chrpa1/19809/Chrysochromulina_OHIO_Genome00007009-RA